MEEGFKELWELAKVAGPFGTLLMLFMWWRTDNRHQKLQEKYDALFERTLNGLNVSANTNTELKNYLMNEFKRK